MTSNRKFFVTTITVRVLSEGYPIITDIDLDTLAYKVDEGDCVALDQVGSQEQVTPERMADLLDEAGSEPGFFQLDAEGNDVDYDEN